MNEKEIREILISYLSDKHLNEAKLTFIKELFVNNFTCRADLVMANGKLSAFEIKSKFDNLNRLPDQLENFTRYFEEVTVVCAEKHLNKVLQLANAEVGVWLIGDNGKLKIIRRAKRKKLPKGVWLSHLPVDELKSLLKNHDLPRSGIREILINRAESKIAIPPIRSYVIEYFKGRENKIRLIKQKRQILPIDISSNIDKKANIENFLSSMLSGESISQVLPRRTAKNQNPHPTPVHLN